MEASSFWLFACERLNGLLGSVPTNHQAIKVQLMRKFTSSQQLLNTSDDSTLYDLFGPFQETVTIVVPIPTHYRAFNSQGPLTREEHEARC